MVRPKRLYKTEKDGNTRYYYLIKGKKRYIKVPEGISQKQVVKINIKNVAPEGRRIKRRKKRLKVKYEKPIVDGMKKAEIGTTGIKPQLPVYFFQPQKQITAIPEQVKPLKIEELKGDDLKAITKAIEDSKKETMKETRNLLSLLYQGLTVTSKPETLPLPAVEEISGRTSPAGSVEYAEEEEEKTEPMLLEAPPAPPAEEKKEPEAKPKPKEKQVRVILSKLLGGVWTKDDYNSQGNRLDLVSRLNIKYGDAGGIKINSMKEFKSSLNDYYNRQTGKGASLKEGLYNDEIENVLKKRIKDFVPVIPVDKVKDMVKFVKPHMKRFGFIVNTNPSTSDGSGNDGYREGHWRACYFNNEDDFKSAEYFDPLAEGNPEPELLEGMKMIARKMNPENYFLFKVNNLKRQPDGTATCGWHSIKFLDDRFQGIGWDEATGYNDYMEKHKPDGSKDGEKDVKNYFEKYKSYI